VLLFQQASEIPKNMPSSATYLSAMSNHLEEGQTYKASKEPRLLANHKHYITGRKRDEEDAASSMDRGREQAMAK
jgi:hypothetical protein